MSNECTDWLADRGSPPPAHSLLVDDVYEFLDEGGEVRRSLDELEHAFKFNDAVLRHLIVKMDAAETAPSPMMKEEKSRSVDLKDDVKVAA